MTSVSCFECSNKDSILCSICGIAKDGAREHFNQKPITNADRIRSMSDGELADFLDSIIQDWHQGTAQIGDRIIDSWLDWLKEEAEGETDEDKA